MSAAPSHAHSHAANPAPHPAYAELCSLLKAAATLGSIGSLLSWDQETYMPPAAASHRADQSAMISAMVHQRTTSPRVGELIAACEADKPLLADPIVAANIREMRRDYNRATKLPTDLVAELARVGSLAQEVWKDARAKSDFAAFAPMLSQMIQLTRRKAQCYADGAAAGNGKGATELYDFLLDEFEPAVSAERIDAIFRPLRDRLAALISQVARSPYKPDRTLLEIDVPPANQEAFARRVLAAMRFDMNAGRLDTTAHPFCSGMAPGDTRLTFRYAKDGFLEPLYGVMHEAGHGLYEQGLPKARHFGTPLAEAISLGFHESQSRMWENFVGRSPQFWQWAIAPARETLGPVIQSFSADDLYRAANFVTPSFIRVEADEATYNLHVMLRFQMERAIFSGSLAVRDIPGAWNETFEKLLGLKIPDDRRGCLQDVHWSFGLFGYFPTYTLGNLYAAQLWETINTQIPTLPDQMARGEFGELKSWLNTNIHSHGRRFRSEELCQKLTGAPLSADPLMRHLESRLRPIYKL
ncbi:MAG: carboxypeptidase M32 [Phycisphaerales bacterium]